GSLEVALNFSVRLDGQELRVAPVQDFHAVPGGDTSGIRQNGADHQFVIEVIHNLDDAVEVVAVRVKQVRDRQVVGREKRVKVSGLHDPETTNPVVPKLTEDDL